MPGEITVEGGVGQLCKCPKALAPFTGPGSLDGCPRRFPKRMLVEFQSADPSSKEKPWDHIKDSKKKRECSPGAQTPVATPACRMGGPGFKARLRLLTPASCRCRPGRQQRRLRCWGRPGWSPPLLALVLAIVGTGERTSQWESYRGNPLSLCLSNK